MNDEDVSVLIAGTALQTDPAALRKALAAVLDECDGLNESASFYRMRAKAQLSKNSGHGLISAARAEVAERAAEGIEEALITAFGLWPACPPGEAEP